MFFVHSVLDNEQKVNSGTPFPHEDKTWKISLCLQDRHYVQLTPNGAKEYFSLSHLQDLCQVENFQVGIYRWGS